MPDPGDLRVRTGRAERLFCWGFGSGGTMAAVSVRHRRKPSGERDRRWGVEVVTSGTNAMRGSAPETAHGHAAGAKL
jgi:hypothetical protein